jgi:hypothetical protein
VLKQQSVAGQDLRQRGEQTIHFKRVIEFFGSKKMNVYFCSNTKENVKH